MSSAKIYCVAWLYDDYGCVILDSRKLFHVYCLRKHSNIMCLRLMRSSWIYATPTLKGNISKTNERDLICLFYRLTISSCVCVRMSRYWARRKFGEHERGVRVARGAAFQRDKSAPSSCFPSSFYDLCLSIPFEIANTELPLRRCIRSCCNRIRPRPFYDVNGLLLLAPYFKWVSTSLRFKTTLRRIIRMTVPGLSCYMLLRCVIP